MRTLPFFLLALTTLAACGGDDAPTSDAGADGSSALDSAVFDSGVDGGGADAAMTDAPVDAAADAALPDGSSTNDGGACGCVEETLRWELDGGFVAYLSSNEIRACRTYVYSRTTFGGGGTTTTCTNDVPCDEPAVTMNDLLAALAHADVVSAFAAAPVLYGRDGRAFDAPLFEITRGSDTVSLGLPCAGMSGCTEVPAGLDALRTLLNELSGERLAEEDCSSIFP